MKTDMSQQQPNGLLCMYSGHDIGNIVVCDMDDNSIGLVIKYGMHIILPWTAKVKASYSSGILKYFRECSSDAFVCSPPLRCYFIYNTDRISL